MQKEFILITGHEALKYINGQYKLSRQHAKWMLFLQEFTFSLKHQSRNLSKFLKMAYFIACWKTMDVYRVAQLYFSEMVHLHGIPKSITLDRDVKFMSNFWKSSWGRMGTQLNFNSAYHP
jgi:hypothetical protein